MILPARKEEPILSKQWPFTLAAIILLIVGATLVIFGPGLGVSEYAGWSLLPLAYAISLYPQRAPKRRWLALGTFFVLAEIGFLLLAFWNGGIALWVSIPLFIAAILAIYLIPPRMPFWSKKETPEAQA
jgi:hypothetical protein